MQGIKRGLAAACALSAFAVPAAASADTYGALFEAPTYKAGDINTQGGWTKTGGYDAMVAPVPAGLTPQLGAQSLRISNAVASGAFGDQTFSPAVVDGAGEPDSATYGAAGGDRMPRLTTSFTFASAAPEAQQTGLSISVSPDNGLGARMSYVRLEDLEGGLAVSFDDYNADGTYNDTLVASGLNRSVPHKVRLVTTFKPGPANDVVEVYVDGTLVRTGTSWESYYRDRGEAVPVVDQLLFRVKDPAPATQGQGLLIDDVVVSSSDPGAGQGPAGPTGSQGANGVDGATGAAGATGQPGQTGPSGGAGATGATGQPGAAPTRVATPFYVASGKVDRRHGVVTVRLRNPKAPGLYTGAMRLRAAGRAIGSRSFEADGTKAMTLRVRLSKSARKALGKRRVQVSVMTRDAAGLAARTSRTIG
jgi:hypothetical protein